MGIRDLVLEIGAEELPASSAYMGIEQLREKSEKIFSFNRLSFKEIQTMATPRRLVLYVKGLSEKQNEFVEEVKGPAKHVSYTDAGEPTAAAIGFARAQGVKPSELIVKKISSGEYVFAVKKEKGKPTIQLLPQILPELILSLTFPKSMRWEGDLKFPRPIRWLLSFYGDEPIKFSLSHLTRRDVTFGHRLLSKGPISVLSVDDYFKALKKGKVIVDHKEREALIESEIKKLALEVNAKALINPRVFSEVVQLTEHPCAVIGEFSREFLSLPGEVIVTVMESHQRYFPLETLDGKLINKFIVIHNGDGKFDALIKKGHERVLKARLADAKFFFEEDKKKSLADYAERLKGVVYQEKLGTLFDKTMRLRELAKTIAEKLALSDEVIKNLERAAYLCKADLVTSMVVEFPELQGVMGREYACLSGEPEAVANAIYEHYLPRTTADSLPSFLEGKILSLADKLDNVVSCFSIGLLPTGSEDPYSLRKQATGIINIISENEYRLSLNELVEFLAEKVGIKSDSFKETKTALEDFFLNRLRAQLLEEGYRFDSIDAVLTLKLFDVVDIKSRIKTLDEMHDSKIMEDIVVAFTRCKNLSDLTAGAVVNSSYLSEDTEKKLFSSLIETERLLVEPLKILDYGGALEVLASLRPIIDKFFDDVLVMVEEPAIRNNRLALLNKGVNLFMKIADFSKLVVLGENS